MQGITVLDGGMGRELARIGAPFRQPEWSALALMEAPHYVGLAHDAFIAAGADVITANSYAIVPFHIGEERFRHDGVALATLAGQLARQSASRASRPVRVAGSLPPTGGSYRPDLFDAAHADAILATLVDGLDPYVDLWLAETQSLTDEIGAVRRALGANPKPLWVSFTLRDEVEAGARPVLRSGQTLDEAIDAALSARAAALLFNCSQPEVMGAAVEAVQGAHARTGSALPVGVYANAFPPQRDDAQANEELHGLRGDLDPRGYAKWAEQWLALGAQIVGGCCGISPDHIAALRDAVDARSAGRAGAGQ
ncbi:MAG: homocysteine S-methyltransferase family protein [Burkholderia sp.]|jgi:S-methylmethionine-dependent homocysteine/selenocysteine methylase|uniref:homocysteine S-methyltransferase family protein n=1 Tax=Burkholderia sp. TaxID=36773 RepID=UPI002828C77E|nr:homocysteine S-methyltransferase family protein [Burkholderia sp.]MDR0240427.1 homocysteine S-methyltransferase family protein [Burkholderia sp.]